MKEYKYDEVRNSATSFAVPSNAYKVIMIVVSSMCDNNYAFTFSKREDGTWSLACGGLSGGVSHSYSNFGIEHHKEDLLQAAAEYRWDDVVKMINGGYQLVAEVNCYGPPKAKAHYAFMFAGEDPTDTSVVIVEHEDVDGAAVKALQSIGWDEKDAMDLVYGDIMKNLPVGCSIYNKQVDIDATADVIRIGGWDIYLRI